MSDTPLPETLTADLFPPELRAALRSYDRPVVCIEQVPEEMESALKSLLEKAIQAYENRTPGLKVILSESSGSKPLCGIYFNLHSPCARKIGKAESSKG